MKKKNFILSIIIIFFLSLFFIPDFSYAGTPKIVNKLNSGFEDIEKWCLKLGTPAAAVAVAVGLFMKKFSFGDEERIRCAKKIIRGSLISYGFLLAIDLILAAIKSLIS